MPVSSLDACHYGSSNSLLNPPTSDATAARRRWPVLLAALLLLLGCAGLVSWAAVDPTGLHQAPYRLAPLVPAALRPAEWHGPWRPLRAAPAPAPPPGQRRRWRDLTEEDPEESEDDGGGGEGVWTGKEATAAPVPKGAPANPPKRAPPSQSSKAPRPKAKGVLPMKITSAEFVTSAGRLDQFLTDPIPHFVFSGRSNVGKSSLLNALVRKKELAKTSATPGKTRLVNYFRINNGKFFFVDVPGYGYAAVSRNESNKWGRLMDAYLQSTPGIACVFQLLDARHDPSTLDVQMIDWLLHEGRPYKFILTKADKLSARQLNEQVDRISAALKVPRETIIPTSSQTGVGLKEVLQCVSTMYTAAAERLTELEQFGFGTKQFAYRRRGPEEEEEAAEAAEWAGDDEAADPGGEDSDDGPLPVRIAM